VGRDEEGGEGKEIVVGMVVQGVEALMAVVLEGVV
jgi:hypothetical protein